MRVQTTIALPQELLEEVDRQGRDRSKLIERALRAFLGLTGSSDAEARDREILEAHADELNREAEDALEYQVPLKRVPGSFLQA
jgi:metal-responsive CopG/Arc/MetJ family transcriptional regulator